MSEITLHMGPAGEANTIRISWFDENNVAQRDVIEVEVLPEDKPRTLQIRVNGKITWQKDRTSERFIR